MNQGARTPTFLRLLGATATVAALSLPTPALAWPSYPDLLPHAPNATNGKECITCHDNPEGGNGCTNGTAPNGCSSAVKPCLNPFGVQFKSQSSNNYTWNAWLAAQDADGDGFTNGEELQDPAGTWSVGNSAPGIESRATLPGYGYARCGASSFYSPGQGNADKDGYCWFGRDLDNDDTCLDSASEKSSHSDCNDNNATIYPGAPETCNLFYAAGWRLGTDNNCDGVVYAYTAACDSVQDDDHDGYCEGGGQDFSSPADWDCVDSGENTSAVDCNDGVAAANPGNTVEISCSDGYDNDCDGDIDVADNDCDVTRDQDGDGYCPIGRDFNNDGDCLDTLENVRGAVDCNDIPGMGEMINSGFKEGLASGLSTCQDAIDNDCDGLVDLGLGEVLGDPGCLPYKDEDGDGFCELGQDGNADGDCLDADEQTTKVIDCLDSDASVYLDAPEVCTDAIDHDCDGEANLNDLDCGDYVDNDGDGYCENGKDENLNGHCADKSDTQLLTDCDDTVKGINPEATEICADGLDNNCDNITDAQDDVCIEYRDLDNDGYCVRGQDLNDDGDCSDPSEQNRTSDAAPEDPTINPGADENCFDGKDNDQDGSADLSDADCTADSDPDGDGYCPVGTDLNMDGDCLDENEQEGGDCNESDVTYNTGAPELCLDGFDNDCDGLVDDEDDSCDTYRDNDDDGYCANGIDHNRDGDCFDDGEELEGADCDDDNDEVGPRQAEICDDGLDNDCDGYADNNDPECGAGLNEAPGGGGCAISPKHAPAAPLTVAAFVMLMLRRRRH